MLTRHIFTAHLYCVALQVNRIFIVAIPKQNLEVSSFRVTTWKQSETHLRILFFFFKSEGGHAGKRREEGKDL